MELQNPMSKDATAKGIIARKTTASAIKHKLTATQTANAMIAITQIIPKNANMNLLKKGLRIAFDSNLFY